jgi:hypothetical protein
MKMSFAGKWMVLEIMMLSKITSQGRTRKTNATFFSHMRGADVKGRKKDVNAKRGRFGGAGGRWEGG